MIVKQLRRISFGELGYEHLPELHRIVSNPDVGRYWETRGAAIPMHDLSELIFGRMSCQLVVVTTDGRVMGFCALSDISADDLHASVSLFMDRPYWGGGYAVEMLAGYASMVFEATPAEKLYLPMHSEVYSRMRGIRRYLDLEGHLKNHVRIDGTSADMYLMALTKRAFKEHMNAGIGKRVLG